MAPLRGCCWFPLATGGFAALHPRLFNSPLRGGLSDDSHHPARSLMRRNGNAPDDSEAETDWKSVLPTAVSLRALQLNPFFSSGYASLPKSAGSGLWKKRGRRIEQVVRAGDVHDGPVADADLVAGGWKQNLLGGEVGELGPLGIAPVVLRPFGVHEARGATRARSMC